VLVVKGLVVSEQPLVCLVALVSVVVELCE
jgi:hypothetical protein